MSFVRLTVVRSGAFVEFEESFDDDTLLPSALNSVFLEARLDLDLPGGSE